jgi:hypothetical protein
LIDSDKQRFNLIFSGQLLPGTDKERAKRTLAAFFGLRDTSGVAVFFSGKPVPLRRNITRSDAQRLYRQLRGVGLICELSAADPSTSAPTAKATPTPAPARPSGPRQSSRSTQAVAAKPRAPLNTVAPKPTTAQSSQPVIRDAPATKQATSDPLPRGKAPNLFALRPAAVPLNPTQLREATQIRAFVFAGAALALCALVLAVALRFPAAPAGQEPLGALAGTTLPGNELVLLLEGALLLHERSGLPRARISAADLGFDRFSPPLWTMENGDILLNAAIGEAQLRLQRCNLEEASCYTFSLETLDSPVIAIASSLLGDSIFLLGEAGQLWRSNSAGELEYTAAVQLPWGQPRILSSGGLLLIPAGDGPMLGVYRPDKQNFGQQLDALLVMPPTAIAAGQDRLRDVALGETSYWALMAGSETAPGLFQLDQQWGNPTRISLPQELHEPFLIGWRDKLLIADPKQVIIQRVAGDGLLETPFESSLLIQERERWIQISKQRSMMRQLGIGLPVVLILLCVAATLLYLASYRALTAMPQKRSALLDPVPAGIHWLPTSTHKDRAVTQMGIVLSLFSVLALALFASLKGWPPAIACLPLVFACLYAWSELRRGRGGHLGLLNKHFIAVDFDGRYFYGEHSLLRGSATIALAPGVVLPVSLPALPNLDTTNIAVERYTAIHKSNRIEILGALWLSHHPWMNAVVAVVAGLLLSSSLLVIIG